MNEPAQSADPGAIVVEGLMKTYPRDPNLFNVAAHVLSGGMRNGKVVLEDVSFSIPKGQVVGLIGANGAGKSTLLRLVAGHAVPTRGSVRSVGKVLSILEVAPGLQDERTGRDNIRYLGALYGMSEAEVDHKEEEVVEFAQLDRFIDYPVRTYSTGMRARLAFSMITSVDADILLIDEALAVGDPGFVQRCRERMRKLCRKGVSAIIVSHSMSSIRELCDRALWLQDGKLKADGAPDVVVENYRLSQLGRAEKEFNERFSRRARSASRAGWLTIEKLDVVGAGGNAVTTLKVEEPFSLEATISSDQEAKKIRARLQFLRVDGVLVTSCESPAITLQCGRTRLIADFGPMRLGRFAYECRITLVDATGAELGERIAVVGVQDYHRSYISTYYQPVEWHVDAAAGVEEISH
ncbi:MAG: ABC transporter ATP-binding protein [Pseudomonadota bacterium]